MAEKTTQVSVTICKGMNNKIQEYVNRGLFSDRQEMIVTAIRDHSNILLECAAESMMVNGHLRNESGCLASKDGRVASHISRFVTMSFGIPDLLDASDYYFPGEPLDERVNIRIPNNLLDVWSFFAPYSLFWTKQSDYIRNCIVMEMRRIDENDKILSAVKMYRNGGSSEEFGEMDRNLRTIIEGRHGTLLG